MSENYISCKAENGSINISEEVISAMVRTAVTEVEGVAGISNTTTGEIAELNKIHVQGHHRSDN